MTMMIANKCQSYVISEGVKWYFNSSSKLFQVDGEAGTGKSVVIKLIVDEIQLKPHEILAMAYTGQAAIVMRTKGMAGAVTCHSGLFDFTPTPVIDKLTGLALIDPIFNTPVMRMGFTPRDLRKSGIKLIIIDESWMVPLSFRKFIEDSGIKVLAVGDSGQLPPVEGEPAYLTGGKIYHLDELMRQSESSPIVYLAHRARRGLPINTGLYGNDVLVMYDDELTTDLIAASHIVICGKNNTRVGINTLIRREVIRTDSEVPLYGERMICKKNNWNVSVDGISLANGLTGTVVRPPKVSNFDGKTFTMDFLPDLLGIPFLDVKCDYKFLKAPFAEKNSIKQSRYSVGEKFDWAYASTVHSAQGSEYPAGIYIEEYLNPQIQNNLNYTAITRFRNKMIYVIRKPKYYYFGS